MTGEHKLTPALHSATPEEGLTALHLAAAAHNPKIAATLLVSLSNTSNERY